MADVVAELRQRGTDSSDREKRVSPRIEVGGKAIVWPIDADNKPGGAVSVFVRDISMRGMGFLVAGAVPSSFIVGLPRSRREPMLVHCRTTFSRELADHLFVVGAEFRQTLQRKDRLGGADHDPVTPDGGIVEKLQS